MKIENISAKEIASSSIGNKIEKTLKNSSNALLKDSNNDTHTATINILFRDGKELTFSHHPEYENKPNFSNSVRIEDGFLVITDQVDDITLYPSDVLLEVKILHDL